MLKSETEKCGALFFIITSLSSLYKLSIITSLLLLYNLIIFTCARACARTRWRGDSWDWGKLNQKNFRKKFQGIYPSQSKRENFFIFSTPFSCLRGENLKRENFFVFQRKNFSGGFLVGNFNCAACHVFNNSNTCF